MGLYGSIADLAISIVGMGINSSGVRQIAEAAGSGEAERIARTADCTAANIVSCSEYWGLSSWSHFPIRCQPGHLAVMNRLAAVALLSLAVFFRLISAGQGALLQGMRRITDLAKMGVLGAIFGDVDQHSTGVFPTRRRSGAISRSHRRNFTCQLLVVQQEGARFKSPVVTSAQVTEEASALLNSASHSWQAAF